MGNTDRVYQDYLQILQEELIPAVGCTEPIAVAYAAARGRQVLGAVPDAVVVEASGNIIKNVKSAVVPHTGNLRGLKAAVAAGVIAGVPERQLEVLADVAVAEHDAIRRYRDQTPIQVSLLATDKVFDLILTLYRGADQVRIRIADYHTNVVLLEKNGQVLLRQTIVAGDAERESRNTLNLEQIWEFTQNVALAEIQPLLDRQIYCNSAIAAEGLHGSYGAGIGKLLQTRGPWGVMERAKAAAAAGSDARMAGCELPVVINSGSGNQGITASVPVIEFANELHSKPEDLYRALVLSNLIAIYLKSKIGYLSAYCGVVSAGVGAGGGIAYLYGAGRTEVEKTISNGIAILSGTICDGAKASCAAKIAAAVEAGILGYWMVREGKEFRGGEGIVADTVEHTLAHVGRLGKEGMKETDREIIRIMVKE